MKSRTFWLRTLMSLPFLIAALPSHAIPVVGASGGSFSSLSSCDDDGYSRTCRIVNTTNGTNTQVQWGSTSYWSDFQNPSRLTAVDLSINTNTTGGGVGVAIGRLDWYNSATHATSDLSTFYVNWSLSLAFSSPSGPDPWGGELFSLGISNPLNPVGDLIYGLGLADLSGLGASLSLAGVSISNLRYAVVDGAGLGTSWFTNHVWYNSENNWSSLYILADFRDARASVPEPGTLALFSMGLLGLALSSRSRRRKI